MFCQVLLLNHICNNLSLSARIQLLTTFIPVSRQLSHISVKLQELFMEVVSLSIVVSLCLILLLTDVVGGWLVCLKLSLTVSTV